MEDSGVHHRSLEEGEPACSAEDSGVGVPPPAAALSGAIAAATKGTLNGTVGHGHFAAPGRQPLVALAPPPGRCRRRRRINISRWLFPCAGSVRYGINDVPPWWLCLLLGMQTFLTMLGSTVLIPLLLVPAMGGDTEGKGKGLTWGVQTSDAGKSRMVV